MLISVKSKSIKLTTEQSIRERRNGPQFIGSLQGNAHRLSLFCQAEVQANTHSPTQQTVGPSMIYVRPWRYKFE